MKKLVLVAAAIGLLVALSVVVAACGSDEIPQGAIVKVGDGVVTQAEFDQYMDQARAQVEDQGQGEFPSPGLPSTTSTRLSSSTTSSSSSSSSRRPRSAICPSLTRRSTSA